MLEETLSDHAENTSRNNTMPLFVTRFGLSDRTAVGVQTKHLLKHFPAYLHLYWREGALDPVFARSQRIENALFARFSFLRNSAASRLLNVSQWRGDAPSSRLAASLRRLRPQIFSIYLAPLEAGDARRMKAIVEILQAPFAVHLWDFLDNEANDPATDWLILHATRTFCLNRNILERVQTLRRDASILTFKRDAAKFVAAPPGKDMKIAIMGDIGSYIEGVISLIHAVETLRAAGGTFRIVYFGAPKTLRRFGFEVHDFITATGFIRSADEKDRLLSTCAVGFISGPTAEPDADARSKYSIPSRILDFLAIGLPVVGTIHKGSATYAFCRDHGVDADIMAPDPDLVARALLALADRNAWTAGSRRSLDAFTQLIDAYDVEGLKAALAPR